jgi:hypothetical protein
LCEVIAITAETRQFANGLHATARAKSGKPRKFQRRKIMSRKELTNYRARKFARNAFFQLWAAPLTQIWIRNPANKQNRARFVVPDKEEKWMVGAEFRGVGI